MEKLLFQIAELFMIGVKTGNSVTRGIDILKSLSEGTDRVTDLAKQHGLSKSTTHRLLKSLENTSIVRRDPITRRYYIGPLMLDLASRPIISHQGLTISAFEEMRRLRDLTQETVVLHIRIGLERVCLEELPSFQALRYTAGKGFIAPVYTGSAGKILLAELNDGELDLLLRNIKFAKVGPNTITDQEFLVEEITRARVQGYAVSFSERVPGSASISVPVKGYVCPVALSVLGPESRFRTTVMMEHLEEIKGSSVRISEKMSGSNR
jgi:IclR family acetate operon transcriptional repressor